MGPKFIAEMSMAVEERDMVPGEVVHAQGTIMNAMSFLLYGSMSSYRIKCDNGSKLQPGGNIGRNVLGPQVGRLDIHAEWRAFCWVGEMALFTLNDVIPLWQCSYQVKNFAKFIVVTRDHFDDVIARDSRW